MGVKAPAERDILAACMLLLNLKGAFVWRANSGAMTVYGPGGKKRFVRFNGAPGCSDVLGLLPPRAGRGVYGVFIAVEVKKPGGRLTPSQASFLGRVQAKGGVGLCVHDVKELEAELARLGY
jgi:hypothetical protein